MRVAALTGSFRVLNARGVLVAKVAAGSALAFEPLVPVSAAVTHITGTLTQQSGHFLLTDQVTHVTVEVTGQGLAAHVGRVVQVTGTLNGTATPVAGAIPGNCRGLGSDYGRSRGRSRRWCSRSGAGGAAADVGIGATTVTVSGASRRQLTIGRTRRQRRAARCIPVRSPRRSTRPAQSRRPGQPPGRPPAARQ